MYWFVSEDAVPLFQLIVGYFDGVLFVGACVLIAIFHPMFPIFMKIYDSQSKYYSFRKNSECRW